MALVGRKVKGCFPEEMKPGLSLGDEPEFTKQLRKGEPSRQREEQVDRQRDA